MTTRFILLPITIALLLVTLLGTSNAAEWTIPLAGNAFPKDPTTAGRLRRDTDVTVGGPKRAISVYFRVDRAANLSLAIKGRAKTGSAMIAGQVGDTRLTTMIKSDVVSEQPLGEISIAKPGYVRLELHAAEKEEQGEGQGPAVLSDLIVNSETNDLKIDFVRDNKGNMFYWGRRGPSVHLRYDVPKNRSLQYAYSEITVPVRQDPIGSYYMANGFGQGYFGFQVNSRKERRVLFSVWSPFKTDNPRDIPEDQRIVELGHGPKVHVGKFGNEGSGGQSYLVYPWEAGKTYRFLTEVKPDGDGRTVYTSWFGDKSSDEWLLIASFRRPKTDTHLTGFHSFLESFSPAYGHIGRRAEYGNVWVCDTERKWYECTRARFSVDATGGGRHRLDFTGGAEGHHFFMRNCGFFNETGQPGKTFVRESRTVEQPKIDFESLPRGKQEAN